MSINQKTQKAFLELFKTVIYETDYQTYKPNRQLNSGFLVVDENNKSIEISFNLFHTILNTFGIKDNHINFTTLHKSFSAMMQNDVDYLINTQLIHYLNSPYGCVIPVENIDLFINANISKITVVKAVSYETAKELFNHYLKTAKAPKAQDIENVKILTAEFFNMSIDDISSFENLVVVCDIKNIYPSSAISLLRYLVYKTTGSTLLIKNQETIKLIKKGVPSTIKSYFMSKENQTLAIAKILYNNKRSMAEIFYRYKPLFLAFKSYPNCAPVINEIRRLAKIYHKPLSPVCIQNYNTLLKNNSLSMDKVYELLQNASGRDLIKLINYYCFKDSKSACNIYNIRNNKIYIQSNKIDNIDQGENLIYGGLVLSIYLERLKSHLISLFGNKPIVLIMPDEIDYALPVSEKQFVGNLPYGTVLSGNFNTLGVYWEGKSVDLDLHMEDSCGNHYGWNGLWSNNINNDKAAFSGDIVTAPDGASEFWYNDIKNVNMIYKLCLFNGAIGQKYKLFFTNMTKEEVKSNYVFNPNKMLLPVINNVLNTRQDTLGCKVEDKFYFYGGAMSSRIIPSSVSTFSDEEIISSCVRKIQSYTKIRTLHDLADFDIINPQTAREKMKDTNFAKTHTVIDLTPESLNSRTLFELFDF